MPNENESDNASGDSIDNPTPTDPVSPQQRIPTAQQGYNANANLAVAETKRELHWLEKLNFAGQFCLVIVGIIAACIYRGQLSTMNSQLTEMSVQSSQIQRQTTLMENETMGAKGAVLQFVPSLNVLASKEDGPIFSSTVRAWAGRSTAKNVVLHMEVQRIYLPSMKPIRDSVRCDITAPQLASFETGMNEISRVCELPGFDVTAADEVMFTRQSVKITGSLGYENGFGQIVKEDICQAFLGYRYHAEEKASNGSINLISGEDESFHPCNDFDRLVRRANRFKKRYQENYVPSRP
jgi:hypothetical protein